MNLDATVVFRWNWDRMNEFVCRDFSGTQKECIAYAKENKINLLEVQPKHRWIVNQGGSRSSKNYSIAQALILFAMTNPGEVISVLRKNRSTVANTAMKDYIEVMKTMGVYKRKNHNLSKFEYTFPNGSIIEFFGVDNADKVMGRKRTICHVSEATEFWDEDKMQLEMRTEKFFVCDFNPKEAISWVYDLPDDKKTLFKSTYKMNKFLSQIQIDDIEYLKETDEAMYTIYALGERAETRENVYQKWIKVDQKPPQFTKYIYAIDYGFTHPTVFAKIWYTDREIFVEEMFYLTNLTANDIISKFRELGITHQDTVIAEVARPEINYELRKNNFNIIDADKNVKAGINSVRSVKVYTNSENVWREYQSYKWKKVNGKIVDEVVKHNDDAMDCFIESTLISTDRGQVKITDVVPFKDYALTSNGYKLITDKFHSGKKQVSKYTLHFDTFSLYLSCTDNHLIKTQEGWKEISKLQSGMTVFLNNSLMELDINYTQTEDILCNTSIICTKKYGNSLMEKEKVDITSTTLMEILGIIELKTLKKLNQINTFQSTQVKELKTIKNGLKSSGKLELNQQKNGINQKKDLSGIDSTQSTLILENQICQKSLAKTVQENLNQNHIIMNSVQTTANQLGEENQELIMNKEFVSVVKNLQSINIQEQKIVAISVEETWEDDVYDISVEGEHEFFADGILVHNCIRYANLYIDKYFRGNTKTYIFH